MYFRFGAALFLVVSISLLGIAIEKQNLTLRRELSRQHYRMDVLQDRHVRLRLQSQRLSAVEILFDTIEHKDSGLIQRRIPRHQPPKPATSSGVKVSSESATEDGSDSATQNSKPAAKPRRRVPLLFWQEPVRDPRLRGHQS